MMLIANRSLNKLQTQLAQYYLTKLRKLEASYHQGHEHSLDALSLFDKEWPQIQRWFDWLAEHFKEDEETARLCMAFAEAGIDLLRLRQSPQERLEWLELGLAAAQSLQDQNKEMIHLYLLANLHFSLSNLNQALKYVEKAFELAKHRKDSLYICRTLITWSNILYKSGDYFLSHQQAVEALHLARSLDAIQETGNALNALANAELSQSNYQAAYEHYLEFLTLSERLGSPHNICLALHNLSNASETLGMNTEARLYAQRCLELARQTGNLFQLTTILGMLGYFACEDELMTKARDYLQESLEVAWQAGLPDEELHAWGRIGNLRLLTGDYLGALEAYEQALTLSTQAGYQHFQALSFGCLVQAYRHLGKTPLALEKLREGLELISSLKLPSMQIVYLHELAQLWYELGRFDEAAEYVGIIEDHPEEFDRKDWQDFLSLAQRLEEKLGKADFLAAKIRGKSFQLDTLLQAAQKQL